MNHISEGSEYTLESLPRMTTSSGKVSRLALRLTVLVRFDSALLAASSASNGAPPIIPLYMPRQIVSCAFVRKIDSPQG